MSRLQVDGLNLRYPGVGPAVLDDVSFAVEPGEAVALCGRSGSGKTQTALSLLRLLPVSAEVRGRVCLGDTDILAASQPELRAIRARRIGMVFQDPAASLNPHHRIGDQLRRVLEFHRLASGADARRRVVNWLERVGLPDPAEQARAYPHELSGGMRQRVMIAAALIAKPALLVADEPTTALDTTVQAQVLALIDDLRSEFGVSLLLITHDIGVVAAHSDRLLVMEAGRIVESGATHQVIDSPASAATRALLEAAAGGIETQRAGSRTTLDVEELSVRYRRRVPGRLTAETVVAVEPVDFDIRTGETVALVGESGSGKTSLARSIAGLVPAYRGRITIDGKPVPPSLADRSPAQLAALQMVFQDPAGSLDPSMRIGRSIAEPLGTKMPAESTRSAVAEAMQSAGFDPALAGRFPHQLSGGQLQRAALARALVLKPRVLVCDEPVTALDGTVRLQILRALAARQAETGMAVLFIAHDLTVVRQLSHRVLVMYLGRVVESGATERIFERPRHPYTRALIHAAPDPLTGRSAAAERLPGEPGSVLAPPAGCRFHPRCRFAIEDCRVRSPEFLRDDDGRVACHRVDEIS